jgi:hypothetical protein
MLPSNPKCHRSIKHSPQSSCTAFIKSFNPFLHSSCTAFIKSSINTDRSQKFTQKLTLTQKLKIVHTGPWQTGNAEIEILEEMVRAMVRASSEHIEIVYRVCKVNFSVPELRSLQQIWFLLPCQTQRLALMHCSSARSKGTTIWYMHLKSPEVPDMQIAEILSWVLIKKTSVTKNLVTLNRPIQQTFCLLQIKTRSTIWHTKRWPTTAGRGPHLIS